MTDGTPQTPDAVVEAFAATLDFPLDGFQREAIRTLAGGRSVLVAAPTGAGKTLVGEFALWDAIRRGGKAFYTTPIKALSNQKFNDLRAVHGEHNVGLLTGDNSINGEAPLVVMTTEVLRNMIYEQSPTLGGLASVVMDEVHYLADRDRGAVWEEVLIQLPASVTVAALSATVSNAEEFGAWLDEVRGGDGTGESGGCEVVISELRPVPLEHHYAVNEKLYPVFRSGAGGAGGRKASAEDDAKAAQARGGRPNPEIMMLERRAGQRNRVTRSGRRVGGGLRLRAPRRTDLTLMLADRGWLPAITFIFSRQACDDAVDQVTTAGVQLTSVEERRQIREIVARRVADLPPDDLRVLGYGPWLHSLERGIAAHHAGMVPAFKETVEELFAAGLVKMVFATETLALGINMPARTVVIERLEKWNGKRHELLTPGQFTQLTGRAGRRGKDTIGHAVVAYQRDIDFDVVAGLVGRRTEALVSRFEPNYNMAVNLLRRQSVDDAVALLGQSFAQFQADRQTSGRSEEIERNHRALAGYAEHLVSDLGDFGEYWAIRRELSRAESDGAKARRARRTAAVEDAIAALRPGDVIRLPGGRRGKDQLAAVVETTAAKSGTPLATVVTEDRRSSRVGPREFDRPPEAVGWVRLPNSGGPRQPAYRKAVQRLLFEVTPQGRGVGDLPGVDPSVGEQVAELRARMEAHPVHGDPMLGEVEVWARRHDELRARTERLERGLHRRTRSLVTRFHSVVDLLTGLGYLDDEPSPTEEGLRLAGLYAETDLVLAECLRWGVFDALDPAELAAMASLFTYEARRDDGADPRIPTGRLMDAVESAQRHRARLVDLETMAGLPGTRELDASFMEVTYRWARGADLDRALGTSELTPGDFVRATKMVADLVRQIREAGDEDVADAARQANRMLVRGVVAH